MRSRAATVVLAFALFSAMGSPCVARDKETENLPVARTEVTYFTADTVYIAAGRNQGLDEGDMIEVVRDGEIIATLRIEGLSSRRASAARMTGEVEIEIGDLVRFVPRQREAEAIDPVPIAESLQKTRSKRNAKRRSLRDWGLRGRVGIRYLAVRDKTGSSSDFSQPALDLKLTGRNIGGTGLGLAVDMRTRRTYRQLADGEKQTRDSRRLYRFAGSWAMKGAPLQVTIGRQYAPALANVSVFDGVLAQWSKEKWSFGGFTGMQPGALDFEFSSEVREHGFFVQRRGGRDAKARWAVTGGAVGSYREGEINREFVFVQSRYLGDHFSAYLIQELDYNRGWRKQAEDSTVTSTSTYLNLGYKLSDNIKLGAGYDNRRRIRYYRDFETPETEFDDRYRQGVWGSVSWRFRDRFRLGFNSRTNGGGTAGSSDAHTVTFSANRLTALGLSLRTRSTIYSNPRYEGWLHSATVSANVTRRLQLGLNGGMRAEDPIDPLLDPNDVIWYGFDLSMSLGRHWYWTGSFERTDGDRENNDQIYCSLVYRF